MGEYDDEGVNVLLWLSLFFAAGIWLVINRFQSFHNRAVPFRLAPPPVRPFVITQKAVADHTVGNRTPLRGTQDPEP